MVLSNKKLKQKLRTLLAESQSGNHSTDSAVAVDQELQNLKGQLYASKSHKSKSSRRSKKRKLPSEDQNADLDVLIEEEGEQKQRKEDTGRDEGDEAPENKKKSKKNQTKKWWRERVWKKRRKENAKEKEGEDDEKAMNPEEREQNANKVYVGGIPYYSVEEDIQSFFKSCGTIMEIDCMTFPESGKFRGIAILTFKTEAAAERALALDGADMGGFYLKIQPFKTNRTPKSDFAPEIVEGYNRVYVGNLSWDITEDDLRNLFSDCSISSLRWGMDKETEEFKGYAHVDFSDSVSVAIALKLDQQVVCGRPVRIRCAVLRKSVGNNSSSKSSGQKAEDGKVFNGPDKHSESAEVKVNNSENANSRGKKKRRTCYECGVPGHLSSTCPRKKAMESECSSKAIS